ncbi:hypothetical protein B0T16DRAFT_363164 [Cercophora newfieldiana]|uniref:Lipocalin-like domain-containing protein n=1 Tax=Cercophora newfieldiana TaxID=92897 RepID=A0AA39YTV8_9PEZI|nr:hypothetical protein B0T16DRAFT_363164 [Cercophora newfieldiana]
MKTDHIIKAFVGTWSLTNTTYWKLDNLTEPSNVRFQRGLIVYTPNGYVSANFASSNSSERPTNLVAGALDNGTDAEWALIGKHALAYIGPFTINTSVPATVKKGKILHGPLVAANLPSLEGTVLGREYLIYERDGSQWLNLSFANAAGTTRGDVLWKRVAY